MALAFEFRCPLTNGLHARPASHLAAVAGQFGARARLTNLRTRLEADAASVLELVSAGLLYDDPCRLTVDGPDEAEAFAALKDFLRDRLPACDEPLPLTAPVGPAKLPRVLEGVVASWQAGVGVSSGIGLGALVHARELELPADIGAIPPSTPEIELATLDAALASVAVELEGEQRQAGGMAAGILAALLTMLKDPVLAYQMREYVKEGRSAIQASTLVIAQFSTKLRSAGSVYLAERAADLDDLGLRLVAQIGGIDLTPRRIELTRPAIVAARDLSPSQFLALDRTWLKGLVLADTGATSHVVILARSFGIPAVTGIRDSVSIPADTECLVDGKRGLVLAPLGAAARRFYEREQLAEYRRQARWTATAGAPAATHDGVILEVAANIATEAEAETAVAHGADGVGLFRTEMLFAGREAPPSEDEQYVIYRTAVEALDGRALIIRTLDIGGDKPLAYLHLPQETNPFLGFRGVRLYPAHQELLACQLRAILRASHHGPVKVMAPMISTVDEARWFRGQVEAAQAALTERAEFFDPALPVGIMLEVPAAVLSVTQLSTVVDFFSIGSNDLCQYALAVDRGNPQVAGLFNERQPAFLRLLAHAVEGAHGSGKWIGLCGEMARQPVNLPLLLGLGIDEISLAAPAIPAVKSAVRGLRQAQCLRLWHQALGCATVADVEDLLARDAPLYSTAQLITAELIQLEALSQTKSEAIKELVDLLYVAGRCDEPDAVEQAVWEREETYSTGVGFGIAIPHCKSGRLSADSLCLLRLKQPVEWGALDGRPVELVLLLALREPGAGNRHLKILALLARKLMHEEFRQALLGVRDSAELLALLDQELELTREEV